MLKDTLAVAEYAPAEVVVAYSWKDTVEAATVVKPAPAEKVHVGQFGNEPPPTTSSVAKLVVEVPLRRTVPLALLELFVTSRAVTPEYSASWQLRDAADQLVIVAVAFVIPAAAFVT